MKKDGRMMWRPTAQDRERMETISLATGFSKSKVLRYGLFELCYKLGLEKEAPPDLLKK